VERGAAREIWRTPRASPSQAAPSGEHGGRQRRGSDHIHCRDGDRRRGEEVRTTLARSALGHIRFRRPPCCSPSAPPCPAAPHSTWRQHHKWPGGWTSAPCSSPTLTHSLHRCPTAHCLSNPPSSPPTPPLWGSAPSLSCLAPMPER
jgi:hypothetical protein